MATMCHNRKCRDWLEDDAVIGLCPSCWFIARVAFNVGMATLALIGAGLALYLLHFDRPYKHARHYLGYAKDVPAVHQRVDTHYGATRGDGKHHRLMQVVRDAGISFTLARIWPDGTREDEKRYKQQSHSARRCPMCRDEARKAEIAHGTSQHRGRSTRPRVSAGT